MCVDPLCHQVYFCRLCSLMVWQPAAPSGTALGSSVSLSQPFNAFSGGGCGSLSHSHRAKLWLPLLATAHAETSWRLPRPFSSECVSDTLLADLCCPTIVHHFTHLCLCCLFLFAREVRAREGERQWFVCVTVPVFFPYSAGVVFKPVWLHTYDCVRICVCEYAHTFLPDFCNGICVSYQCEQSGCVHTAVSLFRLPLFLPCSLPRSLPLSLSLSLSVDSCSSLM